MSRQTHASINLHSLNANLHALQALSANSRTVAVIKADAYGNGAVAVARHIEADIDMFAVATFDEAMQLRKNHLKAPILLLQGPHESEELNATFSHNLHWMIHNPTQLDWLKQSKLSPDKCASHLWLKFDSGMHRLGFALSSFQHILSDFNAFINQKTVIATHLACADEANTDHAITQIKHFLHAVSGAKLPLSIANSAGAIAHIDAKQSYNRLGIALYGSSPFSGAHPNIRLLPVMTLTAHIIGLRKIPRGDCVGYGATWCAQRDSTIATVAIGYADGYPRHAPINTPAVCRNQRIALVGRVSMDMLTFDVSDLPNVQLNDEVELWGEQLPINEVAAYVGTIGYELMTRVSARVPRRYLYQPNSK